MLVLAAPGVLAQDASDTDTPAAVGQHASSSGDPAASFAQDASDAASADATDGVDADDAVVAPHDAAELFALFAAVDGLEARFVEEKRLALLAAPLVSKGRLYFLRPGYLARVVEHPHPATLTITPKELRMAGPDGVETIDLGQSDVVRGFVTSLVQVFSGDEHELQRAYVVAFTEHASPSSAAQPTEDGAIDKAVAGAETEAHSPTPSTTWTLTLTPRAEPLTRMLARLELHGAGALVQQIVVHEPNGDRTTTHLEQVDAQRRFSDEERYELFGLAPR